MRSGSALASRRLGRAGNPSDHGSLHQLRATHVPDSTRCAAAGRSACAPMHVTPASARLPCRPRTTALRATLPDLSDKPKAPDSAPAKAPAPRKQPDPAPRPPSNPGPDDKPSTVEVVLDKAADSALDIYRHVRRLVQAKPTSSAVDRLVRGGETANSREGAGISDSQGPCTHRRSCTTHVESLQLVTRPLRRY